MSVARCERVWVGQAESVEQGAQIVQLIACGTCPAQDVVGAQLTAFRQRPDYRAACSRGAIGQNRAARQFRQLFLARDIFRSHRLVGEFQNVEIQTSGSDSSADRRRLLVGRDFGIRTVADDACKSGRGYSGNVPDRDLRRDGIGIGYRADIHGCCLGRGGPSVQL